MHGLQTCMVLVTNVQEQILSKTQEHQNVPTVLSKNEKKLQEATISPF